MQKGKGYRGGLGRSALTVALVLARLVGECWAEDAWQRGMGGVIFPVRDHPAAAGPAGGYFLASVSAADLFSIPGLYESTACFSIVRTRYMAGMLWERTGITGYSRDLLKASLGLALPGGFLHLTLIVGADSRNVSGYGRDTVILPACSLSLEVSSIALVEVEGGIRPHEGPAHATVRAGRSTSFLVLTVGRDGHGGRVARSGGSVSVTGSVSFLAGYDLETGEASGGLAIRAPVTAAVSWSIHPELGSTFSVSVGAVR